MATEPYRSNIGHFLNAGEWRCVLCGQTVGAIPSLHYCAAETRIREIIREEIARAEKGK